MSLRWTVVFSSSIICVVSKCLQGGMTSGRNHAPSTSGHLDAHWLYYRQTVQASVTPMNMHNYVPLHHLPLQHKCKVLSFMHLSKFRQSKTYGLLGLTRTFETWKEASSHLSLSCFIRIQYCWSADWCSIVMSSWRTTPMTGYLSGSASTESRTVVSERLYNYE